MNRCSRLCPSSGIASRTGRLDRTRSICSIERSPTTHPSHSSTLISLEPRSTLVQPLESSPSIPRDYRTMWTAACLRLHPRFSLLLSPSSHLEVTGSSWGLDLAPNRPKKRKKPSRARLLCCYLGKKAEKSVTGKCSNLKQS